MHKRIETKQPISELLKQINPEYLRDMLNFPLSTITRDLCNTDRLDTVHKAAKHGNLPALKELADAGAKFDTVTLEYGMSPLHFAAEYNHADVVDYLIKVQHLSADIPCKPVASHVKDSTPLCLSAQHGCVESTDALLKAGANVKHKTSQGTALSYAYGSLWCPKQENGKVISLLEEAESKTLPPTLN